MRGASEELGVAFMYFTGPTDDDDIPPHLRGKLVALVAICHTGDPKAAAAEIAPIRALLTPDADFVEPTAYADFQCSIDDPPGYRNWWAASSLDELEEDAIEAIHEHALSLPGWASQIFIVPWGGAVARVPEGATPLAGRDAKWIVHPLALWEGAENDEACMAWGRSLRSAMDRFAKPTVFPNFVGKEDGDAAFGGNAQRLLDVKRRYDPDGVFLGNHPVAPVAPERAAA
jgi:hypothetical protein